uniref:Chorismate synthase n=1 Tax=Chromera velia CCMP2878 TaxID=1169474 RepID=A0A0G4H5N0_9ALVE|eukprot:Cvel_24742.t1-p1 / transcript=Cvel_24742.t1 / gene=Cvel_24742 / organism=Chromera_velia_CCMP2878 / gene_product=Chorismate synthase, putative / transcript_product=Chorismate synthase, putative / location=Cvel_scaffold2717:13821-19699(-) / protein_length=484 / sequence_SO=supercontig / SO=protein_coding / is_pseudo=false
MSVFGTLFRVSTFGESHGVGVGCIIDGVPPGLKLTEADIQPQLTRRRPGQSALTTPRQETDTVQILSGCENGVTLGTPIGLLVRNQDQRKFDYANTLDHPRPGHADYTYQVKYGVKASSGGGRASARETIGRVAAGAVAEKWLLETYGSTIVSWVSAAGRVSLPPAEAKKLEAQPPTRAEVDRLGMLFVLPDGNYRDVNGVSYCSKTGEPLPNASASANGGEKEAEKDLKVVHTRCPHPPTAARIAAHIGELREAHDSTGGILTTAVSSIPIGVGEPCFDKLEAEMAKAMLSLPATKGFEFGEGFAGVSMRGSEHNDLFVARLPSEAAHVPSPAAAGAVSSSDPVPVLLSKTNHAGGTLGGIASGQNFVFRVAIKAVSSISIQQESCRFSGKMDTLEVKGRHDPCVLPRAPPLVEGMAAMVVIDAVMRQRARAGPCPLAVIPSGWVAGGPALNGLLSLSGGEAGTAQADGGAEGAERPAKKARA